MNKKKKIIIAGVLAIILLVVVIVCACYAKAQKDSKILVAKESFDLSNITKLDLESGVGDINLRIIDSGDCTIEEYANIQLSKTEKFDGKCDGDTFKINNPIESNEDVIGLKDLSININIPANILKEMSITADVGNLLIEDKTKNTEIKLDDLEIDNDVGDVTISNKINSNNIIINNSIGNVSTKGLQGSLVNVTNGTGNITVDSLIFTKTSKVETDIGDVTVGIANDCFVDAKTDTGSVKVDKNIKNKSNKESLNFIVRSNIGNINVVDKR